MAASAANSKPATKVQTIIAVVVTAFQRGPASVPRPLKTVPRALARNLSLNDVAFAVYAILPEGGLGCWLTATEEGAPSLSL